MVAYIRSINATGILKIYDRTNFSIAEYKEYKRTEEWRYLKVTEEEVMRCE
ncbi:MAG: hypothetical protein C5S52_07650 [ANME-2 cluster archaeon]|nr:hypothetical protein [ANME-2 cluster archaeon]